MLRFRSLLCGFLFFILPLAHAGIILTTLEGKQINFSALKGKWVLINYWASWCHPCIDEIAELNRFYQTHKDNVALFAVNFDALPLAEQKDLARKYELTYPALAEDPGSALNLGDIRGVPVTFVFDPEGNYRETLYGGQTEASLAKAVM
ncbi:TlpA family protein disulfide reductase [Legionella dresdenensis]|uniref:TlpA family protein disulfide reductase n=1 Tax=Legionella dresdenensis TaxID=450200 RepID=A0ABV8CE15_9GAMM